MEYEAYDGKLASRVTSLYAQLESLTTTVAQLRRDAPGRAAKAYAEQLRRALREDEEEEKLEDLEGEEEMKEEEEEEEQQSAGQDTEMADAGPTSTTATTTRTQRKGPMTRSRAKLEISLGTENEAERWRSGEMAEVYEDALRTLLRLQGEGVSVDTSGDGTDGNALSSTLGKAERAGRAVEVVEKKKKEDKK